MAHGTVKKSKTAAAPAANHAAYERRLPDCQRCRIAPASLDTPASSNAAPPIKPASTTQPSTNLETAKSGLDDRCAVKLIDKIFVGEKVVAGGKSSGELLRSLGPLTVETVCHEPAKQCDHDSQDAQHQFKRSATGFHGARDQQRERDMRRSAQSRSSRLQWKATQESRAVPSIDQGLSCG